MAQSQSQSHQASQGQSNAKQQQQQEQQHPQQHPQQQQQQQQHQLQQQQPPQRSQHQQQTPKKTAGQQPSTSQHLVPDQWVCVLCRKICHYKGLGDLYGPYHIDFSTQPQATGQMQQQIQQQHGDKSSKAKKSKYSLLNHNYAVKEIWIHEDCLVWSEGVHLVGKKILKMEDTIKASFNHNCAICKTKGATIGCAGARCRRKFHYICGRDTNCLLDEANFTLKCDKCLANTAASLSLSINR